MATFPSVPVPDYPIREGKYYDVLVTNIPGKERTRTRHTTPIRSWRLTYNAIHDGDCKYLWDFFNARKGRLESFTFVHPESAVSYIARFADDTLKREEIGENLFDVTIELREIL